MHIRSGAFRGFAHGIGHSIGFANPDPYGTPVIAHDNGYSEGKTSPTFDHFCDSRNVNNNFVYILVKIQSARIPS